LSEVFYSVPTTFSSLEKPKEFGRDGVLETAAKQFQTLAQAKPLHPTYPVIKSAMADAINDVLVGANF